MKVKYDPPFACSYSFETLAVVRNIEDPTAERIVPLVPELAMQNAQTPADYLVKFEHT